MKNMIRTSLVSSLHSQLFFTMLGVETGNEAMPDHVTLRCYEYRLLTYCEQNFSLTTLPSALIHTRLVPFVLYTNVY